jgi:predicted dehydrogenase/threonine dehydrogenase-like Zn-dependent dehydrogenase
MEQLTQSLKDGAMQLLEVPFPALSPGCVLVRNHFSVISAGTEGKTIKDARLGYIGKARARKEELKKVVQSARTVGLLTTYKMVMNKLEAPSALGYSCAGEVIAVAAGITDIRPGDIVACGGSGAVHAEVVAVPVNLCAKVPANVPVQEAAFTTIGAIALQGIRQADLRLGESCVVIGLGVVGQLTLQLLNASGVKAIGIDVDDKQVELASRSNNSVYNRNREDLEAIINIETNGFGADAVIITAGTNSTDPVDFAGIICRKKGKVIIVGAVPTGFARKNYYIKELDLRMSSSYGPGRYDAEYEEKGIDYPQAYVRWTENRNMQAFVDLLSEKRISMEQVITHTFNFEKAPDAYQMILDKSEAFAGIVLKYDIDKVVKSTVTLTDKKAKAGEVNAGFIGAGSFAQNIMLPALNNQINFIGIATARPNNSRNMADKYQFSYCAASADELLNDASINTIFVATRHDSHYEYVKKSIEKGKHVFVEKPLCLHPEELEELKDLYKDGRSIVMVGFNRRFAPFIQQIKKSLDPAVPCAIQYRINSGTIPPDHWVQDMETGGGRIIGEVCHFIDTCIYLAGSTVKTVSAIAMKSSPQLNDTLSIQLLFNNGSIANISYFSNGNKEVNKERIEVFASGTVYIVDDYKTIQIFGKSSKTINLTQDKGHAAELAAFTNAIKKGDSSPISFKEICHTTDTTFKVLESITLNGESQHLQS